MNIVLFIHEKASEKGENLKNRLTERLKGQSMEIIRTVKDLNIRLKNFPRYRDRDLYILLADSPSRLNDLASLIDLFEDIRLLLVLPDDARVTTSLAHKFLPRYFTVISETYDDLGDVIIKMTN